MTLLLASAVLGVLIGSFLNVVVHRVPAGESVIHPGSRCPDCGHAVRSRDNVPIVSWLVLRGRCRDCGTAISPRYVLVELITGAVFVFVGWAVGWSWALPAYLYLAAIAVALTAIDLNVKRLPDRIVKPSYAVLLVLLGGASAATGDWDALVRAVVCGLVLWGFYVLVWFLKPGGMGLGDVKLAGVLGFALGWWGWSAFAVGSFAAFALGGVVSCALLLFTNAGRKSRIPFGPYMLVGAVAALAIGSPIAQWYLDVLGLGVTA